MASFKRISLIIQKNYELLQCLEVQISHYLKMFSFSTTQKKRLSGRITVTDTVVWKPICFLLNSNPKCRRSSLRSVFSQVVASGDKCTEREVADPKAIPKPLIQCVYSTIKPSVFPCCKLVSSSLSPSIQTNSWV